VKKYILILLLLSFIVSNCLLHAQTLTIASGSDLTIKSGTVFSADSLVLIPSADFTLANINMSKNTTAFHPVLNPYTSRVYRFSANTAPFSGAVRINYLDGELNGLPEPTLQVNIHDNTSWRFFTSNTNDVVNNFVLSNTISSLALNEVTLAAALAPLPLTWLSFTATKQNTAVLLQWSTANELNTKNFTVQHSIDGIQWNNLITLLKNTSSSNTHAYSYIHINPEKSVNYYRILQTDIDGRGSQSIVRTVKFAADNSSFYVLANPVSSTIKVQVNTAMALSLYTANGKLLLQKQYNAGLQNIDVSKFAKGIYLLTGNNTTLKLTIQ
jgi:Secretion system C-terminal sorting domain